MRCDDRFKHQFLKTKMCKFYMKGDCLKGTACLHAHSKDELRPMPDLSRTSLCPWVVSQGFCHKGEQCTHAHNVHELKATPAFYKSSVCLFHIKGHCKLGSNCRYSHSADLLLFPSEEQTNMVIAHNGALMKNIDPVVYNQLFSVRTGSDKSTESCSESDNDVRRREDDDDEDVDDLLSKLFELANDCL